MKITSSIIALIGLMLLNLVFSSQSSPSESLKSFVSTVKDRIGVDEMSQMLKKANPEDLVGSARAKELLRLEDIKIYHCTKEELEARKGICNRVGGNDEDVHRFCASRFNELVNFCTGRFEDVVRAANNLLNQNTKQEINMNIVNISEKMVSKPIQELRQAVEKYVDEKVSFWGGEYFKESCQEFKQAMISAETILEYSNKKFADLSIYSDFLFGQYKMYESCQAWSEKYAKTEA